MQKKLDMMLKIILFLAFIVFFTNFHFDLRPTIMESFGTISPFQEILFSTIIELVFLGCFFLFPPFGLITYYLIYRKTLKNRIRKNSKFEKQNLQYCREHLNHLAPSLLSYLQDFKIEFEKDISAHILKLLYEHYLVEESGNFKIENKDTSSLSNSDKIILEIIKDKKISANKQKEYEQTIEQETKKHKLITYKNLEIKKLLYTFFGFLIPAIAIDLFVFVYTFHNIENASIMLIFIDLALIGLVVFLFIYMFIRIYSMLSCKTNIIRTKKGNQILKNSLELKNFLTDFSNLEHSTWLEVYTRDYYLIYAVVLGINKKIPKEIMKMLEH